MGVKKYINNKDKRLMKFAQFYRDIYLNSYLDLPKCLNKITRTSKECLREYNYDCTN